MSSPKLYSLTGIVYPSEVEVKQRLNHAEYDWHRFRLDFVLDAALYPVEDIQGPVRAQRYQVVGVYNRRDFGLAEEQELREDAEGFEG